MAERAGMLGLRVCRNAQTGCLRFRPDAGTIGLAARLRWMKG